ncbi:hypothetical protein L2E82_48101 [Cichorium intybus]|uniref:Uncharacterized protein n=1 Tax=Cichorium intybus TaxID=13427 RepID=A0ACB8YXG1_CICIN|nr:hypothetical protein L2E82_48101 [Cichorium intybus]
MPKLTMCTQVTLRPYSPTLLTLNHEILIPLFNLSAPLHQNSVNLTDFSNFLAQYRSSPSSVNSTYTDRSIALFGAASPPLLRRNPSA